MNFSGANEKNDFDNSIADKLPTGTSLGLKALRMIDSTLETDLYSPKPYLRPEFDRLTSTDGLTLRFSRP